MASIEKDLKSQIKKLYGLIDAGTLVISSLEIEEVLLLVMEIAKRVVEAEASSLLIYDEKTDMLGYEVALGEKGSEVKNLFSLKLGQGIAGWVAQHRQPLLIADVEKDERFFRGSDEQTGFKSRSILCVPMQAHGKLLGVLEVINPLQRDAFNEGDLEMLAAFSGLAAIAIENANLSRKKIEEQVLRQQLIISKQIQENLLVKSFPRMEFYEGWGVTRSAQEIGGDFFDFLDLGRGRLGTVIGDVSGRGVPAALYMVKTLSEFRLEAYASFKISRILQNLNTRLVQNSTMGMFVTLCYAVFDPSTGIVEFANAGHLPVYIYRGRGKRFDQVRLASGLPLGILEDAQIKTQKIKLEKGETVFLLTDGVVEAKNEQGEDFGWDRFESYLSDLSADLTCQQITERLFSSLDRFRGHFAIPDDVTFLAVKYTGALKT
jgi:sigma-B regulation protein RsbU (phosphoserine phosphatase)